MLLERLIEIKNRKIESRLHCIDIDADNYSFLIIKVSLMEKWMGVYGVLQYLILSVASVQENWYETVSFFLFRFKKSHMSDSE